MHASQARILPRVSGGGGPSEAVEGVGLSIFARQLATQQPRDRSGHRGRESAALPLLATATSHHGRRLEPVFDLDHVPRHRPLWRDSPARRRNPVRTDLPHVAVGTANLVAICEALAKEEPRARKGIGAVCEQTTSTACSL